MLTQCSTYRGCLRCCGEAVWKERQSLALAEPRLAILLQQRRAAVRAWHPGLQQAAEGVVSNWWPRAIQPLRRGCSSRDQEEVQEQPCREGDPRLWQRGGRGNSPMWGLWSLTAEAIFIFHSVQYDC